MKRFFKEFLKTGQDDIKKNTAFLVGGKGLAQIITILAYPLIARLYNPSAFGQLAVITSIHSLLVVLSTGRYELAVVMPKSDEDASFLVSMGLRIGIIVSLSILPVTLLVKFTSGILNINPVITNWYFLLPVSVITAAYYQLQTGWCTRFKLYRVIVSSAFILYASTAAIKIILGLLKVKDGLLYSFFIAQALVAVYLYINQSRSSFAQILLSFSNKILPAASKYKNFPKYNLSVSLISTFSGNLPVYLLALYFSDNFIGQLSLAFTILFKPIGLYNESVYVVLVKRTMEMRHQNKAVWPFIKRYIVKNLIAGITGGILVAAFIPMVVKLYLGSGWQMTGELIRLMLPWAVLLVPAGSLAFIPNIFNLQLKAFYIEIIYLIARFMALIAGIICNSIVLGIGLFSLTGMLVISYRLIWYKKLLERADEELKYSGR